MDYLLSELSEVRLGELQTLVIFVDNRPPNETDYARISLGFWTSRIRYKCKEQWGMLYVQASAQNGMNHTHMCWAGAYVLEALSVILPKST